jgi:hypothetical protein
MSDVLPNPQVYLYPQAIGPLLNRLDQLLIRHVGSIPRLVGHINRCQMRMAVWGDCLSHGIAARECDWVSFLGFHFSALVQRQ